MYRMNVSDALIAANDVQYRESPAVAATTRRTLARIPSLKDSYPDGDVVIINVETGSDFVDACSSMLNFKVTTSAAANLSSAKATILDIFKEVVIYARNGTELLRQPFYNIYRRATLPYEKDQEWLDTVGSAFGWNSAAVDHAAGVTYSVPLLVFTELFCRDQKLPPQLMSGMRMEFVLERAQKAFTWANENPVTYTVNEVILLADTHTLTDAISRKIMADSASQGLVLQWNDYSHYSQDIEGSRATVNYQKSVSRACKALVVVQDNSVATGKIDLHVGDSLASEAFDVKESRFRIGALYLPRQQLDRPTSHYLNNLRAYKKLHMHSASNTSVTFPSFKTESVVATLLDRDDELENSGVSTSRAQGDLLLEISFEGAKARRLHCYIEYAKELEQGLTSVVINE